VGITKKQIQKEIDQTTLEINNQQELLQKLSDRKIQLTKDLETAPDDPTPAKKYIDSRYSSDGNLRPFSPFRK